MGVGSILYESSNCKILSAFPLAMTEWIIVNPGLSWNFGGFVYDQDFNQEIYKGIVTKIPSISYFIWWS